MTADGADDPRAFARAARRAGLTLAATALFWILALEVGRVYDLPGRVRGLLDLLALAGFGWGLWLTFRLWRMRRGDKG